MRAHENINIEFEFDRAGGVSTVVLSVLEAEDVMKHGIFAVAGFRTPCVDHGSLGAAMALR